MSVAVAKSTTDTLRPPPLRVMVVDDSAVIRGLVTRWLDAEPDIEVVGSLRTGRDAVNQIESIDPDVAVLDIEMPDLDGISALPLLLAKKRNLIVIMASTLTLRNAEISLKALSLGAADYIPKPESTREQGAAETFRRDLVEKIRHLGPRRRRLASPSLAPAQDAGRDPLRRPLVAASPAHAAPTLVPFSMQTPRVLLIGSSTGGPQALMALIGEIAPVIDRVPVLITQHMPPTFTTILAEHLARSSHRPAREAVDGEEINAGTIYLAPGGRHMTVARRDGTAVIVLIDGAPVHYCKPAVDPLFASAAEVWGSWNLALILTGMGSDGATGAAEVVKAGGSVIAQDEATSVVWGMPGAAVSAGVCSAVLPLEQIAPKVSRLFLGARA